MKPNKNSQFGFSLIESMVGLVVSSLIVLGAFSATTFIVYQQKWAGGEHRLKTNQQISSVNMEFDLQNVGRGFYQNGRSICGYLWANNVAGTIFSDNNAFSPFLTSKQTALFTDIRTGTHQFTVSYFGGDEVSPIALSENMPSDMSYVRVKGFTSIKAGDEVIVGQQVSPAKCVLRTVTSIAIETDGSKTLYFNPVGSKNQSRYPNFKGYVTGDLVYPVQKFYSFEYTLASSGSTGYGNDTKTGLVRRNLFDQWGTPTSGVELELKNVNAFNYLLFQKSTSSWVDPNATTVSSSDIGAVKVGAYQIQESFRRKSSDCISNLPTTLNGLSFNWIVALSNATCYNISNITKTVSYQNNLL